MAVLKMKNLSGLLATLLLTLPVCFSLLTPYVPEGHDTSEYLTRQVEFHRNILEGVLIPQWAPDLARGAGEPLFEFNPPMIYYLAEFWYLLGCNVVVSVNLACVVLVLASAAGAYLLGRLYFGPWGGWLAATAYLYCPYFAVDLYVRGALAELAAFPFFAFTLYGFGAYAQSRRRGYWLLGTASYAGVLLSHNAAALFFTPMLLAFFVFTAQRVGNWNLAGKQLLGWLLGLGLSAYIWLPALAERKHVGLERLLEGYLRYSNHFVYPGQLISWVWGYGKSIPGDQDSISYSLGWTHLILVLVVIAIALKRPKLVDRNWLWFFGATTLVFCFMMTPASEWIWDRVSLLQYVEFPWRMLGPAALFIALLVAPLGPVLRNVPRWGTLLFALALAGMIVPNATHNRPKNYRAELLSEWTPTRLSIRGVEASTTFEYVPRWLKEWPIYNPRGFRVVAGDAEVEKTGSTVTSWAGAIRASQPSTIELFIEYFPGWTVLVDGEAAKIWPADPTGLIQFEVPAGAHQVEAMWKRTWPRLTGQSLSLISLLAFTVLLLFEARPKTRGVSEMPRA